jgi:hypothetical protein
MRAFALAIVMLSPGFVGADDAAARRAEDAASRAEAAAVRSEAAAARTEAAIERLERLIEQMDRGREPRRHPAPATR